MIKTVYTVDEAVKDTGFTRAAVIAMFQAIAFKGIADFKIGRRGHPSRLEG
ncbi:hypothetical protein [Brevundimonas sp.]|uniref:hypothetical protein n=1 Tax=Brevundimonas sp. TaxID=1871086 RepID=UPI001D48C36C|nr:hypothetical protein [Brevundimonas sp.]MBL0948760.1 hypothetical protein [Brevundimonas sp.]